MKIVVTYDSTVSSAPAGFTAAVQTAVAYYESHFDAPVTINITIGWGSAAGEMIPDGAVGASSPEGILLTYDQVRNALWYDARTSNTLTAAMNLPAADPTNGGMFFMTTAQAKAVGLLAGDDTGSDGTIIIDDASAYTFDPNNRAVAGKYDIIGVLEHEIGHILGRISFLGETLPGGAKLYGALDLFRYSAPGTLAPAATNTYFSIDGQNLLLPFNDPSNGGTESDWSIAITGDVYDAFAELGVQPQFSATDLIMQDLFGYHPHQGAPATTLPNTSPISEASLADNAQIAQGQTAYFNGVYGYKLQGSATNAGRIINSSAFGGVTLSDDNAPAFSVFTNAVTGALLAQATDNGTAYAINVGLSRTISNSGLIQSVSQGIAYGVYSGSTDPFINPSKFINTSSGILRVWAKYDAVGVRFNLGGDFTNAGLAEVVSGESSGDLGAVGVLGPTAFNNQGTLRVINANGATPSVGVWITGFAKSGRQFTNSGTIIADYAFYGSEGWSRSVYEPDINIANSGKIIGAISLAHGLNQIHNTGTIGGNIYFGNSTGLYDGASGHLYGNIFLGYGANSVTLSGDGGTVYGGGGSDTITGGAGNDTFLIARGANQLNGGGGFNTLSLQSALRSFTVNLAAGTAVGAGTSTVANIQRVIASDFGDTLIAGNAAATFIGGAGSDIMRGGAAADTLIASAGGDMLTGNGGNDTFIYTAGDGQVVITDFRANGNLDLLKIFGYAGAASTQQQGADTLITLSGGDTIRLKNVSVGSLAGGAVAYSVNDYAAPLMPTPRARFGSGGIYLNYALTVYAGEQISANLGSDHVGYAGITMDGDTNRPDAVTGINSSGSMSFAAGGGDIYGIDVGGNIEVGSAFVNGSGANFAIANTNGNAYGIRAYSFSDTPDLVNAGNFQVSAAGALKEAKGVVTWDAGFSFNNAVTGTFSVAAGSWAYGLDLHNGGTVRNDGLFSVSGTGNVYGILEDHFPGQFYSSGTGSAAGPIINNGTITVSGTPGSTTYGILLSGGDYVERPPAPIINAGTISAQIAIQAWDPGYSPHQAPSVDIQNSGTINGDIILGGAISRISNIGTINGNIFIRNDYAGYTFNYFPQYGLTYGPGDTIDLRGGAFNGYIRISPGYAGDVEVKDVVYTGAATTTVKIDGGQSHLTATVRASQAGHTTVEYDMASSGANWTKQSDGSWLVSAGSRGTQTLINVEALRFTDKTVSLPFTLTWAGSFSGDFTGDGRADILWQRSNGTTQLWGTDSGGAIVSNTVSSLADPELTTVLDVADYNGDGKDDILLRSFTGAVTLRLMNGASVTDTRNLQAMDSSWSVRGSGDFDGDGKADILWQKTDGTVVIWQMKANDDVASGTRLGVVSGAWSLSSVSDYNGDGKADVLLRNADGNVYDWIMNGAGIAGSNSLGIMDNSWSVKGAGDFGGDGKSDLLWQKTDGSTVIWQMNGAGAVGSGTNLGIVNPAIWSLSAVADYNGDGKADVLLRNADGSLANWLMNGAAIAGSNSLGTADAPTLKPPPPVANDFGGDGRADILWQNSDGSGVIWHMSSAGAVDTMSNLSAVTAAYSGVGDFNGDGKTDILLRDTDGSVASRLMNGGVITSTNSLGSMDGSWSLKGLGDFGGEGRSDILWQKSDGNVVIWQTNAGGTSYSATALGAVDPTVWSLLNVADFNGDGKADVLLRNSNGAVYNWIMNGAGIAGSNSLGTMDSSWSVKGAGDFGGDGKSDLLWQKSDGTIVIWQMNGNGTVASVTNLGAVSPSVWSLANVADYNGDGKADVLLRNANGSVANWLMNGAAIIGSNNLGAMDSSAVVVPGVRRKTPNDFGGDGRADILWQKSDGTTLIWNMNGSGTVGSSTNLGIMDLSVPIISLGDYNGDGRTDILVRNNATGSVSGLLMGASGIAATKALGVMDSSWSVKGSGDLGGDGRADMLWQKTDGTVVIWQMNGAGTISSATDIGVVNPGIWSLSSIADYNGDGKADVLLRNANGAVYNWIMNGAVIAGSNSLGTMDSTWSVKGTGDFDGDGKADLLWQKSDGTTLIWQMNGAGALASSTNLGVVNPSAWSLSGVADYNADGKADVLLRNVNGSVDSWLMNGATIAGSSTLGSMNNSWTAITR